MALTRALRKHPLYVILVDTRDREHLVVLGTTAIDVSSMPIRAVEAGSDGDTARMRVEMKDVMANTTAIVHLSMRMTFAPPHMLVHMQQQHHQQQQPQQRATATAPAQASAPAAAPVPATAAAASTVPPPTVEADASSASVRTMVQVPARAPRVPALGGAPQTPAAGPSAVRTSMYVPFATVEVEVGRPLSEAALRSSVARTFWPPRAAAPITRDAAAGDTFMPAIEMRVGEAYNTAALRPPVAPAPLPLAAVAKVHDHVNVEQPRSAGKPAEPRAPYAEPAIELVLAADQLRVDQHALAEVADGALAADAARSSAAIAARPAAHARAASGAGRGPSRAALSANMPRRAASVSGAPRKPVQLDALIRSTVSKPRLPAQKHVVPSIARSQPLARRAGAAARAPSSFASARVAASRYTERASVDSSEPPRAQLATGGSLLDALLAELAALRASAAAPH